MIMVILQTARLFKAVAGILHTHEGRGITLLIAFQIIGGAVFYRIAEDWRWVDAFYFCFATLTTVGYGDVVPATDLGKVFTMGYLVTGIGLFVSFGTLVATTLLTQRQRAAE